MCNATYGTHAARRLKNVQLVGPIEVGTAEQSPLNRERINDAIIKCAATLTSRLTDIFSKVLQCCVLHLARV
jgi:hypothetical protein